MERFGEEYDNLRKVPKVTDVRVEDGEIRVFTETLYARDGQYNWHEIGAFQISLNPKERSPRWKNQTRLINGYKAHMHAPHVWDTGAACLGNTVTTFDTLFTGQLWSIAAALAIEFVENVNLADPAGKHIVSWPLGTPPTAVPGEREIVKDEKYLGHRRKYMIACAKRMDEVVAAARNQLIAQRIEIERLEAKLVALLRNKAIAARRKKGFGVCDSAEFAREFDALQKMPQISAIHVEPRVLKLVTETLYANHPGSGERHEIGRFKITIHMDGRGDSIRWFNLNATTHGCVKNQQAPQVLQSGRAFMSEIKESFAELIATAQFSTVAQLAIDFIQQVDADQPSGAHISKWPKASN